MMKNGSKLKYLTMKSAKTKLSKEGERADLTVKRSLSCKLLTGKKINRACVTIICAFIHHIIYYLSGSVTWTDLSLDMQCFMYEEIL